MHVRRADSEGRPPTSGGRRASAPLADLTVQCELLIEQAWIAIWSARWNRAVELAVKRVSRCDRSRRAGTAVPCLVADRRVRSAKGLPDADAAGHEALRAAHASGDERLIGMAEANLALIADNRGKWKPAISGYSRSGRAFRRCGDVVNVAAVELNQATILVELGDVETAYALAADAARVFAAAGDAERAAIATGVSLRAMIRAGLGDGTQVPGIETCIAVLAAQGNEEVTAFQDVGLIESLLLTGNIAAATRRAVRLIDVVDRFGDDHLLPTTVRRLLAVAADAAGDRSAGEQWLHEARTRADLHRIKPEQAAIAAIDARRASHDRAPDEQRLAEVFSPTRRSARCAVSTDVSARSRQRRAMISGTESARADAERSNVAARGGVRGEAERCRPSRLRGLVGHSVKVEPLPTSGSTHTVVELLTTPLTNRHRASTSAITLSEL